MAGVLALLMAAAPGHAQEAAPSAAATPQAPDPGLQAKAGEAVEALGAAMRQLRSAPPDASKVVGDACNQAMEALARGDAQEALDKLAPLTRYLPLESFPSFRVQSVQAQAYTLLKDETRAQQHVLRAAVLHAGLNRGLTPQAPLLLTHPVQIGDLVAIAGGKANELRVHPDTSGRQLMALTFQDDPQGLRTRYIDTSAAMSSRAAQPRYSVALTPDMPADMHAALAQSQQLLARFYADTSMDFLKLEGALREARASADRLLQQRQPAEAMRALQALAAIRPLEEIPDVLLLMRLSYLHGALGQPAEQQRMRRQLFGLQQAIAATGDALGFDTAVEVPFIEIEYDWLRDHQLRSTKQSLVNRAEQSFDVLDVVDAQGNASQRYFNVTRMMKLRTAKMGRNP